MRSSGLGILILMVFFFFFEFNGGSGNSGRIVLSSEFDFTKATLMGFDFDTENFVPFPPGTGTVPDIVLEEFRLLNGDLKPSFTAPSGENGFALLGSFSSLEESEEYYTDLKTIDSTLRFSSGTDTVRLYQVYAFLSMEGNYAKLLVRDIRKQPDASSEHLEVDIDYYYQTDGTTQLSK